MLFRSWIGIQTSIFENKHDHTSHKTSMHVEKKNRQQWSQLSGKEVHSRVCKSSAEGFMDINIKNGSEMTIFPIWHQANKEDLQLHILTNVTYKQHNNMNVYVIQKTVYFQLQ